MTTETSHGVPATPEISAKDNAGAFASPAVATPATGAIDTSDPTQGGKTMPIGGADGQQAGIYKPQGLADHLIGQTDKETIDRLTAAYTGARTELAKGQTPVPQPGEYKWNWSDTMKQIGSVVTSDPAVQEFSALAHEHGFTQSQIDAIPKFFDKMVEKGVIEKPFDSGKFLAELAPEAFRGSPEEKQAKGGERLAQAEAWIKQLDPAAHGFDEGMKQELRLLTTSKDGVRVVEKLMRSGMNPSVNAGGTGQQQALSKGQLDARVADPRNDSTKHDKYDPEFAAETRRMFKAMYPD